MGTSANSLLPDLTDLDDDDDDDEDDSTISARSASDSTEGTFFGDVLSRLKNYGAGHEHDHLTRRDDLADVENPNKADFPAGVDFDLSGYDLSELERRDEDDSDYLQDWDEDVQKRDFPDDETDDDSNERYHDTTEDIEVDASESVAAQATAAADAARRSVRRAVDSAEEEAGGVVKALKGWLRRPARRPVE